MECNVYSENKLISLKIELRRGTAKIFKEDKNNTISTTRTNVIPLNY